MRIEFKTVFDNYVNQQVAQLYVKYFMDKQNKAYRNTEILAVVVAAMSFIGGIAGDALALSFIGIGYMLFIFLVIGIAKKKTIPKSLIETNGVGCPFEITFGLYDEYFYMKSENNMSINEHSIRYEFLKKVVETPECFVLMSARSNIFYLPKRDMGYENALTFSAFCRAKIPYIYSFKNQ